MTNREYSAVGSYSAPSSDYLSPFVPSLSSLGTDVTLVTITKPNIIARYIKTGIAKILSTEPVGELGGIRCTIRCGIEHRDDILKDEMRPLTFSIDHMIPITNIPKMIEIIKAWCNKFFFIEVESVKVESYNEPYCMIFYPMSKSEYLYLTNDEIMSVSVNLNDFIGYELLSINPLTAASLEEQRFPTAKIIHGLWVYESDIDKILSNENLIGLRSEIGSINQLLDSNGDIVVKNDDKRIGIIRELCFVWNLEIDKLENGDLYIYGAKYLPFNIYDGVREILLGHPPMIITSDLSLESASSLGEFKKDTRVMGDIKSISAWSLKDLSGDASTVREDIPSGEIVVDKTGAWIVYDDRSDILIDVRQSEHNEDKIHKLKEISEYIWRNGLFMSKWGKYLWQTYSIRSVFFLHRPPVFDTLSDAITYLEKMRG